MSKSMNESMKKSLRDARSPDASSAGFTLLEMLTALVIVSILAAVAVPSYMSNVREARRTDAYAALAAAADALEQAYNNQPPPRAYTTSLAALGLDSTSADGHYDLSVAACDDGTLADCYEITAVARTGSPQWKDEDCRTLSIDSRGRRDSAPVATGCWHK